MRTGDGGSVCLHVGLLFRVSSFVSSYETTGEQSSINPVVRILGADDARTCSSPGIAASLWYHLGVAVVLIPEIYAVPTPVTEGALCICVARTGDDEGVLSLCVGPSCMRRLLLGRGTTGKQSSIETVAVLLGAVDEQECSPP